MAFDPTLLLEARARIQDATSGKITANELRMPRFGAAAALLDGAAGLIPGLTALKKSSAQPIRIPVFNKIAAGSGTVRKCAGTGTGTTALVTPTFQGITEEFAISELEQVQNQVGKDKALAYLISQKAKAIYGRIDAIALAFLETKKSAVNLGSYFGALVASAKQVAQADKEDFFAGMQAELKANNFFGMMEFVAGYNLEVLYNKLMNQGKQNAENQAFTVENFIPNFTAVANGTGVKATAYAFEPGTVGIFPWLNQLSRDGADIGTDTWTTFRLPAMPGMGEGLLVELKVKKGCADTTTANSAVIGAEADLVESYVLHVDLAPLAAYSSDTDTGVYKYELLTT
jgi:hypothetical protein